MKLFCIKTDQLFLTLFFLSVASVFSGTVAWAKGEVTHVTTSTQPAEPFAYTGSDGNNYSWGQGDNLLIESFIYNGDSYSYETLADDVVVRRVDNAEATGTPCSLFAETTGVNFSYEASYPGDGTTSDNCDMASVMSGRIINRGVLNLFLNSGDTAKNIERVDFIFTRGISAPFEATLLNKTGHVVTEKSGNNTVKIAAITALDSSGNPSEYGPLIKIEPAGCVNPEICYGITNTVASYDFLGNYSNPPHGYVIYTGEHIEALGMVMVSLVDLGIEAGQKYYGFSYFASDVSETLHTLTNPETFPQDTGIIDGDADFFGGTAGYFSLATLSNIGGKLYRDNNSNGIFDSGEVGIAGVNIRLYEDSNGNNQYDMGIDQELGSSLESDNNGNYLFIGLNDDVYFVVVDTSDDDIPANYAIDGATNPIVLAGSDVSEQNFSFVPVNQSPVANDESGISVQQGQSVSIAVLNNDNDPDGDMLTVTVINAPANGSVTISEEGIVSYTPVSGFSGGDSFVYQIDDGRGGVDSAKVTINVTPAPNQSPVANDESGISVQQGQSVSIAVLNNDNDPDGDMLTVTVINAPANGSVTISEAGIVSYTPVSGFSGSDGFVYQIDDGRGGVDSAKVTIDVTPAPNQSPVANDESGISVQQGQSVSIPVLNNDNDPDGDMLTVTVINAPANGSVTISETGIVSYTPVSGFSGSDGFVYQIDDGRGGVDSAKVTITVEPGSTEQPVNPRDETGTDMIETGLEGHGLGSTGWLPLLPLFFMALYRNFYRRGS